MTMRQRGRRPGPGSQAGRAAGAGPGGSGGAELDGLLARVAHGDAEAFAAVYDQVAGPVYGLVSWLAGESGQPEELAADVLAEVWRTAARFSPAAGGGLSWILAIARRRAAGRLHDSCDLAADTGPRSARAVEEMTRRAGASQDREPVRGFLASLSAPQRQALVLVLCCGYSPRQIAALLGVPTGTVNTRIRDSLLELRDRRLQGETAMGSPQSVPGSNQGVPAGLRADLSMAGNNDAMLSLGGRLDATTTETLHEIAARCLRDEPASLTIDLRDLGFCDIAGVRALRWVVRRAGLSGTGCRIVNPQPQVRHPLMLAGTSDLAAAVGQAPLLTASRPRPGHGQIDTHGSDVEGTSGAAPRR